MTAIREGLSYSQEWSDALNGYHLLLTALGNKHTEVDELLFTNASKVKHRGISISSFNTPLHFAVLNGDIKIVQMLLDRDAENFNGKLALRNAVEITDATHRSNVTPPHLAIKNDSQEITNLLLSTGTDVNAKGNDGTTCLHIATERGYFQIVEQLLKHRADVNSAYTSTLREGYTSLHLAAERGRAEITRLLLSKGADVNAKGRHDTTAIHIATEKGHSEIVQLLLNHGADVNSVYTSAIWEGYTPLLLAAEKGDEEIAELLLRNGADVKATEIRGNASLHIATEKGHILTVAHLINHGADVRSPSRKGRTPLYLAIANEHEEVVKLLLDRGANVHAEDKDGKTMLHFAVEKGNSTIVKHILKHCPDLNNKSNSGVLNVAVQGWYIMYCEIVKDLHQYGFTVDPKDAKIMRTAVKHGYLKCVEKLLTHGTDVNMLCNSAYGKGYISLHLAIKHSCVEVAKLLISYGADVNAPDDTGRRPIFYATRNADLEITKLLLTNKGNVKDNPELLNDAVTEGYIKIVKVLLQHGADANASDKYGRMPLHFIILQEARKTFDYYYSEAPDIGDVKGVIAKLLLSWGANADTRVHNCMPMLHAAIEKGYVKVVEALLEYKADVNSTYEDDITPLHLSTMVGNSEFVEMLLNKGANTNAASTMGETALHFAIEGNFPKIVELLLKHGAKVDARITRYLKSLCTASEVDALKIVKLLIKFGADVNAVMAAFLMPPFDIAAVSRNTEMLECLIKLVGRVDSAITHGATTPLHRAAELDNPNLVELLLKLGANVDSTNESSFTALHSAAMRGNANIVRTLLEHGSDITITTSDEYTALGFVMDGIKRSRANANRLHCSCPHDGDKISNYANIAEILKRHMVKIKAANLYVFNKYILSSSIDDEGQSDFLDEFDGETARVYSKKVREERTLARYDFQDECEKEVARMKSEKFVNTNITFYDILTKDVSQLAMYVRNESIVEAFGSGDYKEKFPIYANMISINYRMGEKRKEFLEQGKKIFYSFFKNFPELPRDCTERIFSYLNDEDLRTFIGDCKPVFFQWR